MCARAKTKTLLQRRSWRNKTAVAAHEDYVWAHDNASDMSAQEIQAFHTSLRIPPELAELLSSENTRELKDMIDVARTPI
jgi:hypothetical protein